MSDQSIKAISTNKYHPDIQVIAENDRWTAEEKIKHFQDGEWMTETDLLIFTYRDHQCKILRTAIKDFPESTHIYGGFLCGYVLMPNNHPYFNKYYGDLDIECHGDLTYCENGWIGFDCAHAGDLTPSNEKIMKENDYFGMNKSHVLKLYPVYRNMEYCINQCINIVDQLIFSSIKD
jgi:hypothetical protein